MPRSQSLRALALGSASLAALCTIAGDFAIRTAAAAEIEEIIVSTRRRAENLQDIPMSVTAFTAETMERKGIRDLADITKLSAGVLLDTIFSPQDTRVVIRGLSPTRGRPNVAFLQDGVDISSEAVQSAGGSLLINPRLFDLERVEIVKGPQSALYGRSAFAGAINYITRKPGDDFQGSVAADVGSYGQVEVRGGVSGPVVDGKLSVGVNAAGWQQGGYYRNSLTGARIGGQSGGGGSFAAVFKPADGAKLTARVEYTDDSADIRPFAYRPSNAVLPVPTAALGTVISPAVPTVTAFVGRVPNAKGLVVTSSPDPRTGRDYTGSSREIFRTTLTGEFDFNAATLTSQTHYAEAHSAQQEENARQRDLNVQGFATIIDFKTRHQLFSQELRLASDREEPGFHWLFGGLYWDERVDQKDFGMACLSIPTAPCGPVIRALLPYDPLRWTRSTDHWSAFAQIDYDISEQLTVGLEARYQDEKLFVGGPTQARTLDPLGLFGRVVRQFTPVPNVDAIAKDNFLTPKVFIDYKPAEGQLVFASVAKGAKPAGVSTVGAATGGFEPELFRFDREEIWVYEAGHKGTWMDGRAQTSVAGYYQDFANKQVTTQIVRSNGLLGTRTVNAGKARVWGLEFEGSLVPTEGLNLALSYAYIDAKYQDFVTTANGASTIATVGNCTIVTLPTVPPSRTCQIDRSGNELEDTVRHSAVLSGSYTWPLSADANWRFDADVKYQDDRFDESDNILTMPGYWMVDARLGIETDSWELTGYVNNLLKDDTVKTAFAFTDFNTIRIVPFPPPFTFVLNNALQAALPDKRQFGLRAKYKF